MNNADDRSPKVAGGGRAEAETKLAWAALAEAECLQQLRSSADGIDSAAAAKRLLAHGANRLTPPKRAGPLRRFLVHFHNVLIYVLLASALVTVLLAQWVDTGVIVGVVVVNAVVSFVLEGRAERSLEAVRRLLSLQATVRRDGRRCVVAAETLVPGDVVLLQSGDKVPADLRLIAAKGLQVQEAALTGESLPVEKSPRPVEAGAPLAERTSMAYAGTIVASGRGTGVVVATGDSTELGRLSGLIGEVPSLATPLIRQMATFGRWLTAAILAVTAVAFAFGTLVQGYPVHEMFMASVGLAVAAIPEGLPAVITITLAIGVQRMARRNAIIRRLPAVEALGSVTVICSDKTGTLTRNELTVRAVATASSRYEVSGTGYDPNGSFARAGTEVAAETDPDLIELLRAGVLCNDSALGRGEDGWAVDGNPTDGALLVAAIKGGLDAEPVARSMPRTDAIPFESERRFMATLHHDHAGRSAVFVKGAPERVIEMCRWERRRGRPAPLDADFWHREADALAGKGYRVLALATREGPHSRRELRHEDVAEGLTLLGLCGLLDAPRPEAREAVARCRAAGIEVKMVTGDHALTAGEVARELGLPESGRVVTGRELAGLDDGQLARLAPAVTVFARTAPEDKLRLVQALQRLGHVVAMTGDGVNDAPALKRADIGVAMGLKSTEAAKETAEMVLADDNFASIAAAVEEGRTVYDNLRKTVTWALPTNGGEGLTILAAVLAGTVLPITPVQILWINLVTAVTLGFALAFEPAEPDIMGRPPRPPGEALLSGFLVWRVALVSLLMVGAAFGSFLIERRLGAGVEAARTVAVNALVVCEAAYLVSSRFLVRSSLGLRVPFENPMVPAAIAAVMALQFLQTYWPPAQALFGTAALGAAEWARVVAAAAVVFAVVEAEKAFLRRRLAKAAAPRAGTP